MPIKKNRYLIAPDSFKRSIDAKTAALAIQRGIYRAQPDAITELFPMADGGEGSAERITAQNNGHWIRAPVTGPDGDQIQSGFGWLAHKRQAVMDIASCGGLAEIGTGNLWHRHSLGVGELIQRILDFDPTELLIGLGGSASNDAGMGMLAALGLVFKDANNQPLPPTPAGLETLDHIDSSAFDQRLSHINISILSDVTNPLCGPSGATAVFGPQKGAEWQDIDALDQRLEQIAHTLITQLQQQTPPGLTSPAHSLAQTPSSGAAGGIGFALLLLPHTRSVSGAHNIAELIGLTQRMSVADVLITGEGCFDSQSLQGKVVGTLLEISQSYPLERVIIAGKTAEPHPLPKRTQLLSLSDFAGSEQRALGEPERLLEQIACQIGLQPPLT